MAALLLGIVGAGCAARSAVVAGAGPSATLHVTAKPLPLQWHTGETVKLTLLSAFELRADDSRFGGFSGLVLTDDARELVAVSDRGSWVSARLKHDSAGRLVAIDTWRIGDLVGFDGRPLRGDMRDAEALATDGHGGWLVSFEREDRIWRYRRGQQGQLEAPTPWAQVPDGDSVPFNRGIEAIAVLANGKLLAFSEGAKDARADTLGWLFDGGTAHALAHLASDGYSPADMDRAPDGRILMVERRYSEQLGFEVRLRGLHESKVVAGARLRPRAIADLSRPLPVDNFEGLAVRRSPSGALVLYLLSDNNFRDDQRTLLYQLRLDGWPCGCGR